MVPYLLLITYVSLLVIARISYRRFWKSQTEKTAELQ